MIYIVPNLITLQPDYVCPNQATIDQGISLGYEGTFVIGDVTTANEILVTNQQNWFNRNQSQFSVNKDIDPDPIQTTWIPCNLDSEPDNNDVDYNIFNPLTGRYTLITGLTNAKTKLSEVKFEYLSAYNLGQYQTWTEWKPLPQSQTVTGVQTL